MAGGGAGGVGGGGGDGSVSGPALTPRRAAELAAVREHLQRVPEEVAAHFGSLAWVKVGGWPYWPAVVVDPLLVTEDALKLWLASDPATHAIVCFYWKYDFSVVKVKALKGWAVNFEAYKVREDRRANGGRGG